MAVAEYRIRRSQRARRVRVTVDPDGTVTVTLPRRAPERAAKEAVQELAPWIARRRRVFACATHGVFSGNAWENLAAAPFEEVVVTDTIPMPADAPPNIRVLSCADLLTDSIRRIFTDDSVAEVFGGENQLF